jgi:hypothetical protein
MNNNMDTKKKKKFNIIDILIVAAILFAVLFAAYFFYSKKNNHNASKDAFPIKYTLTLDIVHKDYHGSVKVGDAFIDSVRSYKIGKVTKVEYGPSTFTALNQETGDLEIYDYPDHEEVKITVKAKANLIDYQYNIGGYDISVGTKVSFQTSGFQGTGFCTDIQETQSSAEKSKFKLK